MAVLDPNSRDAQTIKDDILTRVEGFTNITDHSDNNPWIWLVDAMANASEMVHMWIAITARESNISSCLRFDNAVEHARSYDYRVKGVIPETATLTFSLNVPATAEVTIPIGTVVKTPANLFFETTTLGVIAIGQTAASVTAYQQLRVTNAIIGSSTGTASQSFVIEDQKVVDQSVIATIGGQQYNPANSFVFVKSSDYNFVSGINKDQNMQLDFGDGFQGQIPPVGEDVVVEYTLSEGPLGRAAANSITVLVSSISLPPSTTVTVTNELPSKGGVNAEGLSQIKKNIPLYNQGNFAVITPDQLKNAASAAPGVQQAGAYYNPNGNGRIEIYIVPVGGGIAGDSIIQAVTDYFAERQPITHPVFVQSAGEVEIRFSTTVTVVPGASRSSVQQAIIDAVTQRFGYEQQEVGGTFFKSNLVTTIGNVASVLNSSDIVFTIKPYAQPFNHNNELVWDGEVQPGSSVLTNWSIQYAGSDQFTYKRNSVLLGTFAAGTQISQPEFAFSVSASGIYNIGDTWNIVVYPYGQDFDLEANSIPIVKSSGIALTMEGGIQ